MLKFPFAPDCVFLAFGKPQKPKYKGMICSNSHSMMAPVQNGMQLEVDPIFTLKFSNPGLKHLLWPITENHGKLRFFFWPRGRGFQHLFPRNFICGGLDIKVFSLGKATGFHCVCPWPHPFDCFSGVPDAHQCQLPGPDHRPASHLPHLRPLPPPLPRGTPPPTTQS